MPKDTVEETLTTLEKSLEEKFNKVVKALIQNINGTISEGERKDICNKLNQDGINEIREALQSQANQYEKQKGEIEIAYCAGITKIASVLRSAGLIKTADLIDRDLKTLKEDIAQKYGVDLSE